MAHRRQMTDAELRRVVEWQLGRAQGIDGDEADNNRKRALDSYYGRKRGDEVAGRSAARSQDVADMVEAVVAQIMPSFDFDTVVAFQPNSAQDVDQSRLETRVCNSMLMDRNRGYTLLQEALRDSLLLRNGIVKVFVDETEDTSTSKYTGLSDLELLDLRAPTALNQIVELVRVDEEDGGTFSATIRRETVFRELAIRAIDPINILLEADYDSIFLDQINFMSERHFWTRSELVEKGFSRKVIEGIPSTSLDTKLAASARSRTDTTRSMDAIDPALAMIEVYECYMRVDFDNDGIAERRRILYAGGTSGGVILENQPHPFVPYSSGTPFLQAHRFAGMSLYDKLAQVEEIKTSALRQYLDNLDSMNNRRLVVVDGLVNMDDAVNSRPGGIVRAERVDSVQPIPVDDIGPSSQGLLNYMDKVRSERGGASLDLQAAELQIAGETAHGVERQFTARELLAQLMTRTIGETLLREMFLGIHRTLRRFFPEAIEIEVGGDFVSVQPSGWPPRARVKVIAGLSAGERQQKRQALEGILTQQKELMGQGMSGILVDLTTFHDTLIDWGAAAGIQNPARYWIDPRSQRSLQAQQAAQQQAQQQAQQEQQIQALLFKTQRDIEQMGNQTELFKHATQLRFDYWDRTLRSEIEELRITTQADPELEADQTEGRQRAEQARSGPRAA